MSTIVLHNLPVGCMESDIHRALLIYGTAVNIEMDGRASQAVVTMRTKQEAQALLNRHAVNVSGTSVRVDTQQQQQPQPMAVANPYPYVNPQGTIYTGVPSGVPTPPLQHQQPQHQSYYPPAMGGYDGAPPPSHHLSSNNGSGRSGSAIMPAPPQTSRRLKVVVEDCRYPITRDVLVRMFTMIAPPVVVTCGPYGPTTTGMVEFADPSAAQQAVEQFHSKAIYPDCCYVKLMFEPMWEVPAPAFMENTSTTSTPPMMSAPGAVSYPYGGGAAMQASLPGNVNPYVAPSSADISARYHGWDGRVNNADASHYGGSGSTPYPSSSLTASAAPGGRGHGYSGPGDDGRREYFTLPGRGRGGEGLHGLMVRGGRGAMRGGPMRGGAASPGFSPYNAPSSRMAGPDAVGSRLTVAAPPLPPCDCAVLVSGVAERVPLYDLWVLLEVYGNVRSLKRQHSDRTHVVAQFQHAADTVLAVQYLHGCPFRGMKLRLKRFLGYQERVGIEWDVGPATDPATMASLFETNYHHRVSPHVPRNPRSAMYPDRNVFVSSLTEDITDYELEEMWHRVGFEPVASYRRGPKSSIFGFRDIETAVNALIAVHLRECKGRTLYATFSRFPPEPRPATAVHDGEEDYNDEVPQQHSEEPSYEHEGEHAKEEERPPRTPPPPPSTPGETPESTERKDDLVTAGDTHNDGSASVAGKAAPKSGKGKTKSAKK